MADSDSSAEFTEDEFTEEELSLKYREDFMWNEEEDFMWNEDEEWDEEWNEDESKEDFEARIRRLDFEIRCRRQMQATTEQQKQTCDAVNNVFEEMIQILESNKICDVHLVRQEFLKEVLEYLKDSVTQKTSIQLANRDQPMQATTEQQKEACDAVNNVLKEMIQIPESKKICGVHHVDQEFLKKVLENLKDSVTRETLIQLANRDQMQAHEHEHQERKGKLTSDDDDDRVNNVSGEKEMTYLPTLKKIRYAHDDDDEEIPNKVSEESDYSSPQSSNTPKPPIN